MNQRNELEILNFKNLLAVLSWLQKTGWKISRAGIYKHRAEGKIRQQPDGTYSAKDVDKYSRTFLKRKSTGKRLRDGIDDLQRRKTELEVRKLQIDNARNEHRQQVEEGNYIPKDQFEIEVVSRASVLDAGLAHLFQSEAGAWIHLVGGDQRKLPELIGILIAAKDNLLNQYARSHEFVVEFGEEVGQD
ncbi:MAG: hypothetical protein JRC90_04730 [Deltaproteobacteria bacterium]|nr:hypothetical protein [Deltaproteobacteria bacterium]